MKVFESVYKNYFTGVIFILLVFCCANFATAQGVDSWQHELTIYGWLAGVDGTVKYPGAPGSGVDSSIETSDIVEDLEMVFMGGWQSKYNRWSIIGDVVYMNVGDGASKTLPVGGQGASANVAVDLDIYSWILNGGVGYDVVQADQGNLAVVVGVRYMELDVDLKMDFQRSGIEKSGSDGLLDGIVGVSGQFKLGDNWYVPYHADIGTGGSDLTWQLFAAIGYRFGWGDIRLGYRHLSYELDEDRVMEDLEISGPIMGLGFRF